MIVAQMEMNRTKITPFQASDCWGVWPACVVDGGSRKDNVV